MSKLAIWAGIFCIILTGCSREPAGCTGKGIVKIVSFELSPDESKIAFSALTPVGNTDIWVKDLDGKNLKKLTFQDCSPTNRIAKFFKKHNWKNFFEIDMISPEWTSDGRISFCQKLSKIDFWGAHAVNFIFWTINSDGTDKRRKRDVDRISQRKPFDPINRAEMIDRSEKYKKKIILKDGDLLILDL
ncbi:MAG: hypothetical protein COW92_02135 [Candidatus Omnitrophica bacterium CG22_combo_CG10-13_8_21_14_all_43_16]|nr:MAG: hypothetical protein COW92_02135 [Candidatus Omnitrophica bacterium CG22_combo_CG10-13_8_21_14_all_43_16]